MTLVGLGIGYIYVLFQAPGGIGYSSFVAQVHLIQASIRCSLHYHVPKIPTESTTLSGEDVHS